MKSMITANEALHFMEHTPEEARDTAADIANILALAYRGSIPTDKGLTACCLIFALYNAGRVDGIRSERARRRAALRRDE